MATGPTAIFLLAATLCGTAVADVKIAPAAQGYDIDIDGDTSATDLIEAIAAATGVEIKGEPEDVAIGANHLRNTSLERALRKLLPKAPFAVRFDSDETPEEIIFLSPAEDGGGADGGAGDTTEPSDDAPAEDPDVPDAPDGGG